MNKATPMTDQDAARLNRDFLYALRESCRQDVASAAHRFAISVEVAERVAAFGGEEIEELALSAVPVFALKVDAEVLERLCQSRNGRGSLMLASRRGAIHG